MRRKRRNEELPPVVTEQGWQYHHIGIPSSRRPAKEKRLADLGVHVHGFATSPYGIEWMRFEPRCDVPEIVRTVPHIAFVVQDLERALEGRKVLIEPNAPSDGVRVAFIVHDGAPVELMEFEKAKATRKG